MSQVVLYPPLEPFATEQLATDPPHVLHLEQCGRPDGLPVLFLHGGPASGCSPRHRQFFDPARYRIVLFDQRGSGRSQPHGERQDNDTPALVADIERIRRHLGIERWLVFGGSWGSSLALAYAGAHPANCLGLVLRGIFLTGRADMDWFFEQAQGLAPEAWAAFSGQVGGTRAADILAGYTRQLESPDSAPAAAAAWAAWETTLSRPGAGPAGAGAEGASETSVRKYRLQAAYLNRLCDLDEAAVLAAARCAASLPTAIVHGRLDWVCRPVNAWRLGQVMPGARLRFVDHAGHDPFHAEMAGKLVSATDCFARSGALSRA
ncbi:MAG: prolyl aminopeptidase [Burkholderiaceae bacterium]